MEDPTKTPEPVIKRKSVKTFHPSEQTGMEQKAKDWGYNNHYSQIVGGAQKLKHHWTESVAFDTNKTRREMILPTKKGTYK